MIPVFVQNAVLFLIRPGLVSGNGARACAFTVNQHTFLIVWGMSQLSEIRASNAANTEILNLEIPFS